jgi:DHA2 family multidrug resistance protein
MFTHEHPFMEPGLFADRNFSLGLVMIFIVGVVLLATMALMPPFQQNLLGYPVVDVGLLLAPRGVGTMIAMMLVGRLAGRIDGRAMILLGLALTALSLWDMTGFNAEIAPWDVVRTGVVQGLGLGFVFVPLSTITFATLAPRFRNEGTALFSLVRNIGSSIGISIVVTYLSERTQANHAAFAAFLDPFSFALQSAVQQGVYDLATTQGLAMLNAETTRQAALLAYLQDFRLMMWISLAALPLLLFLRGPAARK